MDKMLEKSVNSQTCPRKLTTQIRNKTRRKTKRPKSLSLRRNPNQRRNQKMQKRKKMTKNKSNKLLKLIRKLSLNLRLR